LENATDFALVQIAGATDDVEEAIYEPFEAATQPGVLAGDALAAEAAKLRAVAQVQGAQIDARLGEASDTLSVARTQTTYVVERLEQIAAAPAQTMAPIAPIAAITPVTAARAARVSAPTAAVNVPELSAPGVPPAAAIEQAQQGPRNLQVSQPTPHRDGVQRASLQSATLSVSEVGGVSGPLSAGAQKTGHQAGAFQAHYAHAKDDEASQLWSPTS